MNGQHPPSPDRRRGEDTASLPLTASALQHEAEGGGGQLANNRRTGLFSKQGGVSDARSLADGRSCLFCLAQTNQASFRTIEPTLPVLAPFVASILPFMLYLVCKVVHDFESNQPYAAMQLLSVG